MVVGIAHHLPNERQIDLMNEQRCGAQGKSEEYMTDPELIDEKFGDIVDLVIDGGIGGIEPSTVVKCTEDEPEIVRQGKGWLEGI